MKDYIRILGPGLLMAAAAIGVSHLVQSTRAGANFGFQLLGFVILANILKYPFFEYGHRYYAATGETLLHGYKKLGQKYLVLFLLINLFAAMASVAGVTLVTAALMQFLLSSQCSLTLISGLILVLCWLLLGIGQYKWLDRFIKILMVILFLATFGAVGVALFNFPGTPPNFEAPSAFTWVSLPFLVALIGWMPAPIEISVWQSLWMEAQEKSRKTKSTMKEALLDFKTGYIACIITAAAFIALGALVMHGSGAEFSTAPAKFASQLVYLYTVNLGAWSETLITVAAFTTMFSTTITLVDAYPRSLAEGTEIAFKNQTTPSRRWRQIWVAINIIISLGVIWFFRASLKGMVDLVTTMAFLAAPIFSFMNFKLVTAEWVPKKYRPSKALRWHSYIGLAFLLIFCGLYFYQRFFL